MTSRDLDDQQWEMSGLPCPFCPHVMRLVGKERPDPNSRGHLLTFQCECGLIFSTRDDQ